MPMSMTYNKPLTERLLSLYHNDLEDLLTVDVFSVYLMSRVDIVICYIKVDLHLGFGLCSLYQRLHYIEVHYMEVLFHTFYCNFGWDVEHRSLYRGLH